MKPLLLGAILLSTSLFAQDTPKPVGEGARRPGNVKIIGEQAKHAAKSASPHWEYKTIAAYDERTEADDLNKLGADGWELASVVYLTHFNSTTVTEGGTTSATRTQQLRYYLKRMLP